MIDLLPSNLIEFERRYREEYLPLYEKFAPSLRILLEELIGKAGIPIDHIECRVKTVESFLEKIKRFEFYDNPFEQIKDCVGIRVITYYQDDVTRVEEMIQKEFTVDEYFSCDKTSELGPKEFGYRAVHLKVSLAMPRVTLQEWEPYAGLFAEIQIRSVLQHAWAIIEHELEYKGQSQPFPELLRRFSRLSAKLEEAEEDVTMLREMSGKIAEEKKRTEINQNKLNLSLNQYTLHEFVNHKLALQEWEQYGIQVGMDPFPRLVSLNHSTSIEILLQTLRHIGISTIGEFESLLQDFEKMKSHMRKFVGLVKSQGETVFAVPVDVLVFLASFSKPDSIAKDFDWGKEYHPIVMEALRETCKDLSSRND